MQQITCRRIRITATIIIHILRFSTIIRVIQRTTMIKSSNICIGMNIIFFPINIATCKESTTCKKADMS